MFEIRKNYIIPVFISAFFILISSILLRINLIVYLAILLISLIVGCYIYRSEKRVFIFSIWSILLSSFFGQFIGIISYLPYICFFILLIKLAEKKFINHENLKTDRFIIFMTFILSTINILALMYNGYETNLVLIIFYSLKKFSYIILYIFFINLKIEKKYILRQVKIFILYAFIQFPFLVIQFLNGVERDDITALFGYRATGVLLQYLLYMIVILIVYNKKICKFKHMDITLMILSLIYCAIAEVKIGFFIIPIIFISTLLLKRKGIKLTLVLVIILVSIKPIYGLFASIYPDHDFISNKNFNTNYMSTGYGEDKVNRSEFMPILQTTIIDTNEKLLFGTGLATTNPSTYKILEGSIYKNYGYLNFDFFALPYLIIENGIIGTIIWLMIYVYIIAKNLYFYLKYKDDESIIIISIIIINLLFVYYNNSIITSPIIIFMTWFLISFFNNKKLKIKY